MNCHALIPYALCLTIDGLAVVGSLACPGEPHGISGNAAKPGTLQLTIRQGHPTTDAKDSVTIILDRFDLTGAGIVHKVYYPDSSGKIILTSIPAGKYIVTVQCRGIHRDSLEKTVKIRPGKTTKILLPQAAAEAYSKSKVIIPPLTPSWPSLTIFRPASHILSCGTKASSSKEK